MLATAIRKSITMKQITVHNHLENSTLQNLLKNNHYCPMIELSPRKFPSICAEYININRKLMNWSSNLPDLINWHKNFLLVTFLSIFSSAKNTRERLFWLIHKNPTCREPEWTWLARCEICIGHTKCGHFHYRTVVKSGRR